MITTKSRNKLRQLKVLLIFILPAFLLYTCLAVLPIVQSIYFSFYDWNGMVTVPLKFVGMDNFIDLNYPDFYKALKNTLLFVVLSPIIQIPIALLLALLLLNNCKGYKFFKAVFFVPLLLSLTAISVMWYFILYPETGALSSLMKIVGLGDLNHNWLIDKKTAVNTLIFVNSWIFIGYYMVIYFAALTSIPNEIMESAEIDGSRGLHRVIRIMIPMIWDVMKVTIVFQVIGNLKVFETIYIMTKGGPDGLTNTLGTLVYNEGFLYMHFGKGSAISTVIFGLCIICTIISLRLMRNKE